MHFLAYLVGLFPYGAQNVIWQHRRWTCLPSFLKNIEHADLAEHVDVDRFCCDSTTDMITQLAPEAMYCTVVTVVIFWVPNCRHLLSDAFCLVGCQTFVKLRLLTFCLSIWLFCWPLYPLPKENYYYHYQFTCLWLSVISMWSSLSILYCGVALEQRKCWKYF